MLPVWKEEIVIRSFDVDCQNQLRISSLCGYFQEAAGRHADHLAVGFDQLRLSGLAWVLSRLEIAIMRLPQWGESIVIETWPSGNERLYYRREFQVTGRIGEKLITAVSFWLPISLQNRRPRAVTLPHDIVQHNTGRYVMTAMTESIPSPMSSPMEMVLIPVRYNDLDVNQHVNNARYAAWITDIFPVEFYYGHVPEFFRIDIRHETKANESVRIIRSGSSREFILEGINDVSQKTCFQAILRFREKMTS
jgi:medium-chain acyl-[acyl-carrier-protein] hydrolase